MAKNSTPEQEPIANDSQGENSINLFLLLIGIAIMLVGSTFPVVFTNAQGQADHGIASLLFWSMSAALVRGVGFIPNNRILRWLFSAWACMLSLGAAIALRFL